MPSDSLVDLPLESIQRCVVGELECHPLPGESRRTDPLDLRQLPAGHANHQDVARVLVLSLREAIGFGSAGIPGPGSDLQRPVPVSQGDIVDGGRLEPAGVDQVGRYGALIVVVGPGTGEALYGAVSQDDPR